jgi:hypothetical protein
MSILRFTSIMKIYNGNPYIEISVVQAEQVKKDWKKPMPVLTRINGEPKAWWQINMMPMGDGRFYLYLHGLVREASNTKVGDTVTVEVKFDSAYKNGPMHPMPVWFQKALDKHKKAKAAWTELIPSRQKEILRYFSWLKSDEAKKRNLQKAMDVLSGMSGRFMARSWNEPTEKKDVKKAKKA